MNDPHEFIKFHDLLLQNAPSGYTPFYFPLTPRAKCPVIARGPWIAAKNRLSPEEAIRWLKFGYNVAIAALDGDQLVIIDVDDMDAFSHDQPPETLSVLTRSRTGIHNFYFTDDTNTKINIPTSFGETRCLNQYVVVAGSFVTTDINNVPDDQKSYSGQYTVSNEMPANYITFDGFPKIFKDQYERAQLIEPPKRQNSGYKSKSALFDLEITDVVPIPKRGSHFSSRLHGSKTGANTNISNGVLKCWRCGVSHNAVTYLAVLAGVDTCQNAGVGFKTSCSGGSSIDMSDGETAYTVWQYARTEGYIPNDDAPPRAALVWFAIETGICGRDEVVDGWQLPEHCYVDAHRLLRTNA